MAIKVTTVCMFSILVVTSIKLIVTGSLLFGSSAASGGHGPSVWMLRLSRRLLSPKHNAVFTSSKDLSAASVCQQAAALQGATARLRNHSAQILLQHLHKAGGTTICHLATFNQHRMWSCKEKKTIASEAMYRGNTDIMSCNCNGPYSTSPFSNLGPEGQLQLLRNFSDATIFFNEDTLSEHPLFDKRLVMVTLVRHPVSRFLSHMLHALALQDEALYNRTLQDPNPAILQVLADPNFEVKDNYMVRMYGGRAVDRVPRHTVRQPHLQRAVDNLDRFTAVFVLEELQGPSQAALDGLLNLTANYSGYRSGTTFSSFNLERKIRPEVLNAMLAYMRYDMQLYGHSKMLHQLTVQGWQAMTEAARHEAMLHKAQEQQGWQQLKFSADGKVSLGMQHAQMRPLCPLLGQLAVQGSAATSAAQHQVLIS